ncbi:hypothetical protein [Heyndrickxia oleronia]|uniref:hypothetical protein n=1 Tax=Heyndrickxia oleronia TaxID=38875 RepID=UPI003F52052F
MAFLLLLMIMLLFKYFFFHRKPSATAAGAIVMAIGIFEYDLFPITLLKVLQNINGSCGF